MEFKRETFFLTMHLGSESKLPGSLTDSLLKDGSLKADFFSGV